MEDKIADYLLDISKLIFAGVVLGTAIQIDGLSALTTLLAGLSATVFTASLALVIIATRKK